MSRRAKTMGLDRAVKRVRLELRRVSSLTDGQFITWVRVSIGLDPLPHASTGGAEQGYNGKQGKRGGRDAEAGV